MKILMTKTKTNKNTITYSVDEVDFGKKVKCRLYLVTKALKDDLGHIPEAIEVEIKTSPAGGSSA